MDLTSAIRHIQFNPKTPLGELYENFSSQKTFQKMLKKIHSIITNNLFETLPLYQKFHNFYRLYVQEINILMNKDRFSMLKNLNLPKDLLLTVFKYDYYFNNKIKFKLEGNSPVYGILKLSDGNIASINQSQTSINIWDLKTGKLIRLLEGHTKTIACYTTFETDKIVSGSHDYTIKIWNYQTGICISTIQEESYIRKITIFPENRIIYAIDSSFLKIWKDKSLITIGKIDDDIIANFHILPDNQVLVGYVNLTLKIFNYKTGKLQVTLNPKVIVAGYNSVKFAMNNENIIAAFSNGTIRIFDIKDYTLKRALNGSNIRRMIVLNDNIITGCDNGMINVWKPGTSKPLQLIGHRGPIMSLKILPNGKFLSVSNNQFRIWNEDFQTELFSERTSSLIYSMTVLPKSIITNEDDGTLTVWE